MCARTALLVSVLALAVAPAGVDAQAAAGEEANALGWTELHSAAAEGRSRDVEALLARGADPNAHDSQGATPLHVACSRSSNDATVEALLSRGADVRATDVLGATPLHWAAGSRRPGAARRLLDAGADVNARAGPQAFTALHAAAATGDLECVELLMGRGADLAARDAWGRTPLDVAESAGHPEVASRLRRAGEAPVGTSAPPPKPPPAAPAPAAPAAEAGSAEREAAEVVPRRQRRKVYLAAWLGMGGGVVNGPDGSTEFVPVLLLPLPLSAGVGLGVPAGRHVLVGAEWNLTLGFNCVATMSEASGGCDRGVLIQHLLATATFFPRSRRAPDVAPGGPFLRTGAGLGLLNSWPADIATTSTGETTPPSGWRRTGWSVLAGLGYAVGLTDAVRGEVGLDFTWDWHGSSPTEPRSSFSSVLRVGLALH